MQIVLALLLQAVLQPAQHPSIDTIRTKMFERLRADSARQTRGARWTKERTDEDITKPLTPKVEHRELYRVWGDGTRMLQQKAWRDGRVVSESPQPLPFFLDAVLLGQFDFALEEPAEVSCGDEHSCWRISFAPRTDSMRPDGDLETEMLAASVGTVLVEKETYGIVRADAHMLEPYSSWKVDVYWFSVSMTQEHHDGLMMTSTIEMSYSYHPLFGSTKTKRRFYRTVGISLPPS